MLIKIIIIIAILGFGITMFSFQENNIFTNASANVIESVKDNMQGISTKTVKSVEGGLDSSSKIIDDGRDKISNEIINVKESSQNLLNENLPQINIIDVPSKKIINQTKETIPGLTTKPSNPNSPPNPSNPDYPPNPNSNNNNDSNIIYSQSVINEKLSLSSVQQINGDVLLDYFDKTGNTKSANVVIRTSEKEIFSGTFYTSNFKTVINDVSGMPYYMDVIIEHKIYGKLKSSIFNSGTSADYKIIGMFAQE